jgi:hypothetical protein
MDEFISKPMRKKVLIEKLALLLSDHPAVARAGRLDAAEWHRQAAGHACSRGRDRRSSFRCSISRC